MTNQFQSIDGYKCSCGFITDDRKKFLAHLGQESRRAKREGISNEHKSLGRVNMSTGEITMPPYDERTPEQKSESSYGRKALKVGADGKTTTVRTTDILSQASEIKFIPRIYTTTYTSIMMQAQDAAAKVWGWRANMPLENFLDTVLFNYFYEHGIELGGYRVEPEAYQVKPGDNHDNEEVPVA